MWRIASIHLRRTLISAERHSSSARVDAISSVRPNFLRTCCDHACWRSRLLVTIRSRWLLSLLFVCLAACSAGDKKDSPPPGGDGGADQMDGMVPEPGEDAAAEHDSGVPFDPALCGNARMDSGESCDDGNRNSGDGCSD